MEETIPVFQYERNPPDTASGNVACLYIWVAPQEVHVKGLQEVWDTSQGAIWRIHVTITLPNMIAIHNILSQKSSKYCFTRKHAGITLTSQLNVLHETEKTNLFLVKNNQTIV